MSTIADKVRTFIPATYDALSKSSQYGSSALQDVVDEVKFRLFGDVVSATVEASDYNAFVQGFAAKVATVRIIPGACDWWSDQMQTEQAQGESISYPDRIKSLWEIHKRLTTEIQSDWPFFVRLFPRPDFMVPGKSSAPRVNTVSELLTPDPKDFGPRSTHRRFGSPDDLRPKVNWAPWETP